MEETFWNAFHYQHNFKWYYLYHKYYGRLPSTNPKSDPNKGAFPSDDAFLKLIYLAARNITRKWAITVQQLPIIFERRLKLEMH